MDRFRGVPAESGRAQIDGREMYVHACKIGLEGVVSKIADSRYHSGRSRDWVKKTCAQRETLTNAGYALE